MAIKRKIKPYEVTSRVVCDDARLEANGKWILIGVYGDAIVVKQFPAKLGRLIFRIGVTFKKTPKSVSFKLLMEDGSERGAGTANLEGATEGAGVLNFDIRNITFEHEETLRVCVGVDEEPHPIGSITIRMPQSDEEKERLSHVT